MMNNIIDYAVIGGGISGVYSAWRLKQACPDKNIQLFEYSDRIGGKLLTVQLPGMPDVNAELGGMRIIPTEQTLMAGLALAMGIKLRDFPMGSDNDSMGKQNFAYFRETHMKVAELANSDLVPFKLNWAERGFGPNELQAQVMKLLVPEWESLHDDDWFEVEVLGRPLWQWGFWNLLYEVLSPEGYRFIREACGYDTNVCNGNAVNLLPTGGEYDGSSHYKTPENGMQAIPVAVAQHFRDLHGELHFNKCLQRIVRDSDGIYELTFAATETIDAKTSIRHQENHERLRAEHVILAMPRVALENIEWHQWQADEFLKKNIPSVLVQDAFKLVLGYDYAWWKSLGLEAGRSLTDLPIRQTLYFGEQPDDFTADDPDCETEHHGKPAVVKLKKALLMASYSDITTVPFWKGLEEGQDFGDEPKGYLATERMVHTAQLQVEELHCQKDLPKPYAAAYMDWSEFPFGGAWHSWKAGFKYNEIIRQMTHPVKSEKVYICGEAYSNDQGWAEGALETAEQMLTRDLGIDQHDSIRHRNDPMRRKRY